MAQSAVREIILAATHRLDGERAPARLQAEKLLRTCAIVLTVALKTRKRLSQVPAAQE